MKSYSTVSHEEPYSPGQNPVVLAAVHKIFKLTDKRGVLIVDRGFDGWVMFEDWLDNKYRFVARLVGKRHLLRSLGGSEQSEAGGQGRCNERSCSLSETPHSVAPALRWTGVHRRF